MVRLSHKSQSTIRARTENGPSEDPVTYEGGFSRTANEISSRNDVSESPNHEYRSRDTHYNRKLVKHAQGLKEKA